MFTLSKEQEEKLNEWVDVQRANYIELQRQNVKDDDPYYVFYKSCWDSGYPYTGAIGADLEYKFVPTSIGTLVSVEYLGTGETLDLTGDL